MKKNISIPEIPSYDMIQIKKKEVVKMKEKMYYEIVEKMLGAKGILSLINKLQTESISILVEAHCPPGNPFNLRGDEEGSLISFIAKYGMDLAISDWAYTAWGKRDSTSFDGDLIRLYGNFIPKLQRSISNMMVSIDNLEEVPLIVYVIQQGWKLATNALAETGAHVNVMVPLENGDQVPLIVYAAKKGWTSTVKALAERGANVNVMVPLENGDQVPLVVYVTQKGWTSTVEVLAKRVVDVDEMVLLTNETEDLFAIGENYAHNEVHLNGDS